MDKEAVGINRPSSEPGGCECHDCGVIFIGDESHTQCGRCYALAQEPAAQAAGLTDGERLEFFESFAQDRVLQKVLYRDDAIRFAEAVESAVLSRAAPSGEPVYQCMCTDDDDGREDIWMDVPREAFAQISKRSDVRSRIVYTAPQPSAQQSEQPACTCGSGPAGGHSRTCAAFDESMMRDNMLAEQPRYAWSKDGKTVKLLNPECLTKYAEQPAEEARGVGLFREAIAWGRAYGPKIAEPAWSKLRDEMAEQFATKLAATAAPAAGTDWAARAMEAELRLAELKAAAGLHGLTNEQIDRILEGSDRRVLQAATGAQWPDIEAIAKAAWDEAWELAFSDGECAGHPLGRSRLNCEDEWGRSEALRVAQAASRKGEA